MHAPEFWSRPSLAATALSPIGWIYGAITDWKRTHASPYRARAKVICVGNLTAGGSGKTPIVEAIVRNLKAQGVHVVVLSRGYGGHLAGPIMVNPQIHTAGDVGDEPLMLSATAPVIVARDREKGAILADIEGADIIVMDDGYQNFALEKDISIVVVDAEKGFGNGRILPAGPLREPAARGLARADAVVLVGQGAPALPGYSGPVLRANLVPRGGEPLTGRKAVAFAGIGRPEKFFATLSTLKVDLSVTQAFPDHHRFTPAEISQLKAKAKQEGAMLVTTEKDFVRLAPADREGIAALPVVAQFEPVNALDALLASVRMKA
ncbi:MAG TPA: tetraacyldisaccharide 4'-kinase [Rhizomicrobium sp.]|nr:tetraacyldisaccharide 4'-kinase [Rhizomicrobium sp.]